MERKTMAKKFKLDDGTKPVVERNTLLEPANKSSAAVSIQEEIREVATQLNVVKKKHDDTKKLCNAKQAELEKVHKEIAQLTLQDQMVDAPELAINCRLEQLKEGIANAQSRIDEETLISGSYRHMLNRMQKDYLASKLQCSDLEASIKSKAAIADMEQHKGRKTKEERLQSKCIFDNLMRNIEKEQSDRQERIVELQRSIKNKEESVQRRIERQRRNAEIAEAAANENKDSSELKMRECLYIQKMWNTFMRKKMEREMKNSATIDDAFKRIKTATSVQDVQVMVQKFLGREQTYSELLATVSSSETKIDNLKKENESLSLRLQELTLDSKGSEKDAKGKEQSLLESDQDLLMLKREKDAAYQVDQKLSERFKAVNIVNDQISTWAKRIYTKFGVLTDDPAFQDEPVNMVKAFECMERACCAELDQISKQREENGEDDQDYQEVFNDFATDEFVNKNIRVRPVSGFVDETKDGRQSNVSRGIDGDEDKEDNFNKMAEIEMSAQRREIKEVLQRKKDDEERKLAAEEAKKKRKLE